MTTKTITVSNVPDTLIDFLRPLATGAGHGDSESAICRSALFEYAKANGWKPDENKDAEKTDAGQ